MENNGEKVEKPFPVTPCVSPSSNTNADHEKKSDSELTNLSQKGKNSDLINRPRSSSDPIPPSHKKEKDDIIANSSQSSKTRKGESRMSFKEYALEQQAKKEKARKTLEEANAGLPEDDADACTPVPMSFKEYAKRKKREKKRMAGAMAKANAAIKKANIAHIEERSSPSSSSSSSSSTTLKKSRRPRVSFALPLEEK